MPTHTCSLGISPTTIVGFTGDNPDQACGWYQNPRFWATPRAYQPSDVQLSTSPPISSAGRGSAKLVTWGNFLALHSREDTGNTQDPIVYLTVARISDWNIRKLVAPTGFQIYPDAFTLTDAYLYIGFRTLDVQDEDSIHTVRRYDLSQFESITQPF